MAGVTGWLELDIATGEVEPVPREVMGAQVAQGLVAQHGPRAFPVQVDRPYRFSLRCLRLGVAAGVC